MDAAAAAMDDGYGDAVPSIGYGDDAAADDDVSASLHALQLSASLPLSSADAALPPLPAAAEASSLPKATAGVRGRRKNDLGWRPSPLDGRELPQWLLCPNWRGILSLHFLVQVLQ